MHATKHPAQLFVHDSAMRLVRCVWDASRYSHEHELRASLTAQGYDGDGACVSLEDCQSQGIDCLEDCAWIVWHVAQV